MESQPNEPSATRSILELIGSALRFAILAGGAAISLLFAGLILMGFFRSRYPWPIPLAVGLLGHALLPLSVVCGIVVGTWPPRSRLLTWRRIGVGGLLVVAATLAIRHYVSALDWAVIRGSTDLQQADDVSDLAMYEDPSFIHPCWVFAHFSIPRDRVAAFVEANGCEATDSTSLRHHRDAIPEDLQSLPAAGKRFYKKGKTGANLPFDMLVDENGTVAMFVSTPD